MTTLTRQWFGTDGLRGAAGVAPITPDFFMALGHAVGRVLQAQYQEVIRVLVGRDPRESGEALENHFVKGLMSAGITRVHKAGIIPTPGIAYLTREDGYHMGAMISASHNVFSDNGIKFFGHGGLKLSDAAELAIEKQLQQQGDAWRSALSQVTEGAGSLESQGIEDSLKRYGAFCVRALGGSLSLKGCSLVLDCAHGAMYPVAPHVLETLGAHVITMGVAPNGRNINAGCGATDVKALCEKVVNTGAQLGIAFDGDGDRLMLVDHTGAVVDGDEILCILLQHYRAKGTWRGGVVGTLMSNLGLERACYALGVPFIRSAVGDRYVLEILQEKQWFLGGENSGHIVCRDKTTTGDGLLAALHVLAALQTSGKSLHHLKQAMKKYPQVLVNVPLPQGVDDVLTQARVRSALAQGEETLGGKGRILLRLSGTEPLVRVMVEGEVLETIERVAHSIAAVIEAL